MPIPVETRSIDVIKQLVNLEFRRNIETGELQIESSYSVGFFDPDGAFVELDTDINQFAPEHAAWILSLKPSDGGLNDPSLAEILIAIFDGIESGQVTLPPLPEPEPDPGDPLP